MWQQANLIWGILQLRLFSWMILGHIKWTADAKWNTRTPEAAFTFSLGSVHSLPQKVSIILLALLLKLNFVCLFHLNPFSGNTRKDFWLQKILGVLWNVGGDISLYDNVEWHVSL